MVLILLVAFIIAPGVGSGIGAFVKQDRKCRELHQATRIRGAMLEVYCDKE